MPWLDAGELAIGLGCMRLPAEEQLAHQTIAAAAGAGITVFDTAHAYGSGPPGLGENERLLARALAAVGGDRCARIVTKGGMRRPGGAWAPDGRAKTLLADCEASLAALDGLPIDLYLIHAPDPRTPWRTSVRALTRLVDQGLVARIGVANVTRGQLDEAAQLAPLAAVQVALSPFDDHALRAWVVARCAELGLTLIAHSPLGGPRRVRRLVGHPELARIAGRLEVTPAEVALAWLLGLSRPLIAIPGARRAESARSAARAAALELDDDERAELTVAFGVREPPSARKRMRLSANVGARGEVVLVMGIPGAGKSRVAAEYAARGYARLNRDERGGSLRALAGELDHQLASGVRRAVLDNTYLTRTARSYVLESAERHALAARCVWLDTPLSEAQLNLVERLVERFGKLPSPEEIRSAARREPWVMLPTSQMRALRELEPPSSDEGFTNIERVPFVRAPGRGHQRGVFVGGASTTRVQALADVDREAPHLLFDWVPDGDVGALRRCASALGAAVAGPVKLAICPHAGGPPSCWCRPPLPGLLLAFARASDVDPTRSTLIGCSGAHQKLATTLGARYISL